MKAKIILLLSKIIELENEKYLLDSFGYNLLKLRTIAKDSNISGELDERIHHYNERVDLIKLKLQQEYQSLMKMPREVLKQMHESFLLSHIENKEQYLEILNQVLEKQISTKKKK